jgi:hypothetical protein
MAVLGSDNISHSGDFKINVNSADRVVVDTTGRLLVGRSTARTNFNGVDSPHIQLEGTTFNNSSLSVVRNSNTSILGGYIVLGKTRSTSSGNAVVTNNDVLGQVDFQGADGTNLIRAAQITARVDGAAGTDNMPGRLEFATTAGGSSTPTERMRITQVGHILIGQTTTAVPGFTNTTVGASFEVISDGSRALFLSREANAGLFINCNANAQVARFFRSGAQVGTISVTTTNTAYNTSSDYRLKENVVDLDGAIDRLKQLPVHRFNFIVEPEITVDGFIAHEAQEVVPECVTGTKDEVEAIGTLTEWNGTVIDTDVPEPEELTWEDSVEVTPAADATYDEEGNELTPAADAVYETVTRTRTWEQTGEQPVYQGIDQSKIVPLLTAALQEAIKRIETLEARVLELEAS